MTWEITWANETIYIEEIVICLMWVLDFATNSGTAMEIDFYFNMN